ncbi:hypothetical protein DICVIV_01670, partial [Dictyocaulus viviparus]
MSNRRESKQYDGMESRIPLMSRLIVVCDFGMGVFLNAALMFMDESNLCECEVPIKVVGDIHAQYQ